MAPPHSRNQQTATSSNLQKAATLYIHLTDSTTKRQQHQQQKSQDMSVIAGNNDEITTTSINEEVGYIKTTTHNYVSRKAQIDGAKQVEIKGRSILQERVHVRGDLCIVRMGRYCEIDADTVLEPPKHPYETSKRIPLVIGSHTRVGRNCKIQAAAIGSMVWIGDQVTLGPRVIIKDNCIIEDGVTLGADTVVPPFSRISAKNPLLAMELPPSMAVHMQEVSLDRYQEFQRGERDRQLKETV